MYSRRDKGVHAFSKGISMKVNITVCLEFEAAYFKVTVQYFSYYVMGNLPP